MGKNKTFSSFQLLQLSLLMSLYWWNKYTFPPTNLYNKTLNHDLPAPSLQGQNMEIPKWQKAPFSSLLFSLQLPEGAPLHIYKDELFYDLCKRGLWGEFSWQTLKHLEKTAAATVNTTITACRRLLPPQHKKKITTVNMLMIYTQTESEIMSESKGCRQLICTQMTEKSWYILLS